MWPRRSRPVPQLTQPLMPITPEPPAQPPALLEELEPLDATALLRGHLHHWSPTLRCVRCGVAYREAVRHG